MNMIAILAAVVILSGASSDNGRYRDTRVSAAIQYTTVDRWGNVLIIDVNTGDPWYREYYGCDYFYYGGRHYYRHPPAYIVYREPIFVRSRYDGRKTYWRDDRDHTNIHVRIDDRDRRWRDDDRSKVRVQVKGDNGKGRGDRSRGNGKGSKGRHKGR